MHRRPVSAVAATAALSLLTACASVDPGDAEVTLGVAAAPSLAGAFTEIIGDFEAENPGVRVHLELGRSADLADALETRTDVHIFASASAEAVRGAVEAGAVAEPEVFARNHVVLAVPSGNPAGVSGLDDLSREELRIGLCDEVVPCGEAADTLLETAGVTPVVDERDAGSRALAARLGDNELDAGIIYRTDVAASHGWVSRVDVEERERLLAQDAGATRYILARVLSGDERGPDGEAAREAGREFRSLVVSDRGREALESAGLQPVTS